MDINIKKAARFLAALPFVMAGAALNANAQVKQEGTKPTLPPVPKTKVYTKQNPATVTQKSGVTIVQSDREDIWAGKKVDQGAPAPVMVGAPAPAEKPTPQYRTVYNVPNFTAEQIRKSEERRKKLTDSQRKYEQKKALEKYARKVQIPAPPQDDLNVGSPPPQDRQRAADTTTHVLTDTVTRSKLIIVNKPKPMVVPVLAEPKRGMEVNVSFDKGLDADPIRGKVDAVTVTVRSDKTGPKVWGQRMLRFFGSFISPLKKLFDQKSRCPNGCVIDDKGNMVDAKSVSLGVEVEREVGLIKKTKTRIVEAEIVNGKVLVDGKEVEVATQTAYEKAMAEKAEADKIVAEELGAIDSTGTVKNKLAKDSLAAAQNDNQKKNPANQSQPASTPPSIFGAAGSTAPKTIQIVQTYKDNIVSLNFHGRIGANYLLSGLKDKGVQKVGAFDKATYPDKAVYPQMMKDYYEPARMRGFVGLGVTARVKLFENLYWDTSFDITRATLPGGIKLLQDPYTGFSPDIGTGGRFGKRVSTGLTWTPRFK